MKSIPVTIILAGTVCMLGTNIYALEPEFVPVPKAENHSYLYALVRNYDGYDALGELEKEQLRLEKLMGDTLRGDLKPTGNLSGFTMGYEKKLQNGDSIVVETSYLSGTPDSSYTLASSGYLSDYDLNYTSDTHGIAKHNVHRYDFSAEYSLARYDYLYFGVAASYSDINMSYGFVTSYTYDETEYDMVSSYDGRSTYDTDRADLLATVAVKPSGYRIFEKDDASLVFTPKAKLGIGFSTRAGDPGWASYGTYSDDTDYSGYTFFADQEDALKDEGYGNDLTDTLPNDAWIYSLSAELQLDYYVQVTSLSVAIGYQYESDFSESDNSIHGLYGKFGFCHNW